MTGEDQPDPEIMHTWHVQFATGQAAHFAARRLHVTESGALIFYSGREDDEHIVNVVAPAAYIVVDKRT